MQRLTSKRFQVANVNICLVITPKMLSDDESGLKEREDRQQEMAVPSKKRVSVHCNMVSETSLEVSAARTRNFSPQL
jgi:hypothetical protein